MEVSPSPESEEGLPPNPPIQTARTRSQKKECQFSTVWSPAEDFLLTNLVKAILSSNLAPSWSAIAKHFPGKTGSQVAGRWAKVLNPDLVKGSWTPEEDQIVIQFAAENNKKNWSELSKLLPGRTGKQCRERYKNHLDPNLSNKKWSKEEDDILIQLHQRLGNQWSKMVPFFKGRTDNCLKNRWNSSLKKRIEREERGEPATQKRGRKKKIETTEANPKVSELDQA